MHKSTGSAAWNMIATALKMPISGTHSIVGATIGFSVVLRGWGSIKWTMILRIVGSWFASPLISGIISSIIYVFISKTIIKKLEPLKYGLKALPLFYGATIFINVASVVIGGPSVLGLDKLSWYSGLFISLVVAGIAICCVAMIMVPKLRRQISDELITYSKRPPKPQLHQGQMTTNLSKLPPTTGSGTGTDLKETKSAFDNVAFKPDEPQVEIVPSTQAQDQQSDASTSATNLEELSLDPKKLMEAAGGSKPPVAPKPAHLFERQQAVSHPPQETQMEEIHLEPPGVKKPDRLSKLRIGKQYDAESCGRRHEMIRGERIEVFRLFSSLQILTACFASFAHGTNDVSNAVAPLIPIWNIYANGHEDIDKQTQVWILAFGGIGICTGLWAWGRAVMKTVGSGLTQLTPSKGFAIELGAAISVLCASKLGLPISTTHCKVGSVVIVGLVGQKFCSQDNLMDVSDLEVREEQGGGKRTANDKSKSVVDWKLFGNIAITWIVTVPLAAIASASVMVVLRWLAL